jgi:serine phosphatase RsbU (regulator of sigma subunit)
MLGISFLNEIIAKESLISPAKILDNLRTYIIKSLQQKGLSGEQKDGMDIVILTIDMFSNKLQFAGANNSLYFVSNIKENESKELPDNSIPEINLIEYKGDKMPVAIYEKMACFTNHEIIINPSDVIYLATDGFEDQFGGPSGKKFMGKKLKHLLSEISQKPMSEQKQILENTLKNWQEGYGEMYSQTDDITILGFKKIRF